jgi:hypothetical protein
VCWVAIVALHSLRIWAGGRFTVGMKGRDDGGVIGLGLHPPLATGLVGGPEQDLVQDHPSWASYRERDHVDDRGPGVHGGLAAAFHAHCKAVAAVDGLPIKTAGQQGGTN